MRLWILRELCDVLGQAHDMGIVHRDIKPQNIMIVPDPSADQGQRVKVLDFGIAKLIKNRASDTASLTMHTEAYLGTLPYSSPEQLGLTLDGQTEPTVDHRSDIYSLGVLLYEMLAGARPFSGTQTKILYDHAHSPPPPFAERAPEAAVPAAVEAVVFRCLEKDPANRPKSVGELFEAFQAAVEEAELEHAPPEFVEPAPIPPGSTTHKGAVSPAREPILITSRPSRLSRKQAAAGLVAASLLIAGSVCVYLLRPSPAPIPVHVNPSKLPQPVSEIARTWLGKHNLQQVVNTEVSSGWPVEVQWNDGGKQHLIRNGSFYVPAGYRADSSSEKATKTGLPRILLDEKYSTRFILIEGGEFQIGAVR